jgi:hypothetical protein
MIALVLEVKRTLKASVLLYPRLLKVAWPLPLVVTLRVPLRTPVPVAGSLSATILTPSNEASYSIVKRGTKNAEERVYTGTDYQQTQRS